MSKNAAELRRRAEARLRNEQENRSSKADDLTSAADSRRSLHELQVHQIELELQNAELQEARDRMEVLLEKYTDLYDFAPVGYFSLDDQGRILEVNLTGAGLVGIERSRLIGRNFGGLVAPELHSVFKSFLKKVLSAQLGHSGDFKLLNRGRPARIVNIQAQRLLNGRECRVAVVDITERKQAESERRRLDVLTASNQKLEQEIIRRQEVEKSLRESEQDQSRLLDQSRQMQEQLRRLSHQILRAQEEERKRISRELHDVITQTLTSINVRLAGLTAGATLDRKALTRKITSTQRLVEKSLRIVHQFARELRPSMLDDLGLIPALHAFVTAFAKRTGLRIHLSIFAGVERLDVAKRTILYRVAQEALTNVARHARATRVDIKIGKISNSVRLQIEDNGRSFPPPEKARSKIGHRLGLVGMRERVEMVGGSFMIESTPGQGATVEARIPFGKTSRARGDGK